MIYDYILMKNKNENFSVEKTERQKEQTLTLVERTVLC